ncbi:MAG: hypothetical protein KAT32_04050 [Candidatus Moranbacteria bacterium]|nr:hypothetical protein [Candidatus Moranbacteria bacterium]
MQKDQIDMYVSRRIYWPAYTWPTQTNYSNIIDNKESEILDKYKWKNKEELKKQISDLFDKLNATFYHLQQLKSAEKKAIKIGSELVKIAIPGFEKAIGVVGSPYEPIQYEYEALLISAKTTLDLLVFIVGKSLGKNTKRINLVSFYHELNQGNSTGIEIKFKTVLNKFSDFIKTFSRDISWRNYAVHKGSLSTGTINIPVNNPKASILKFKALNPYEDDSKQARKLHEVENLDNFCEDIFYSMSDIVIESLEILLDSSFEKGVKMSVQEKMINSN